MAQELPPNPLDDRELVALSPELMSFDLDAISVEELERRFELALGVGLNLTCRCPALQTCGTYCVPPPV